MKLRFGANPKLVDEAKPRTAPAADLNSMKQSQGKADKLSTKSRSEAHAKT